MSRQTTDQEYVNHLTHLAKKLEEFSETTPPNYVLHTGFIHKARQVYPDRFPEPSPSGQVGTKALMLFFYEEEIARVEAGKARAKALKQKDMMAMDDADFRQAHVLKEWFDEHRILAMKNLQRCGRARGQAA